MSMELMSQSLMGRLIRGFLPLKILIDAGMSLDVSPIMPPNLLNEP